jgi:hypothetical protein
VNVFLSWSGPVSGALAKQFSIWLPSVVQSLKPFYSEEIDKGDYWLQQIADRLNKSVTGLVFLTPDNLHSEWIMFEAGSLSKSPLISKVCPIVFGLTKTDLGFPLSQFQITEFEKEDIRLLMRSLNAGLGESALAQEVLDNTFEKWWGDLQRDVEKILSSGPPESQSMVRPTDEVLVELLELVRSLTSEQSRRRSIGPGILLPPEASDEEKALIEDFNVALSFFAEKLFYLLRSGELPPDIRALLGQARQFIARREQIIVEQRRLLVDPLGATISAEDLT